MSSSDRLLVRAADHLVLGVRWSDMAFAPGPAGRGQITASRDGGRVTLVFPPQAVAEAKYDSADDIARRAARLGGPSHVTFKVAAGVSIDLTVEGLLAALTDDRQTIDTAGDGEPTLIELPWHLMITPQHPSSGDTVVTHAAQPVSSDDGVVGLWHMTVHARGAEAADAGLLVRPLRADLDDAQLDVRPLSGLQRQSVVDAGNAVDGPALARARRFELTALGGSLTAGLSTAMLEWNHDATLGRDHHVRVAEHGVLYPFGHRAVYIETAERGLEPAGPHAVAGLHRTELLVVIEPVRSTADGDVEMRRRFPFSAVEILATRFAGIKVPRDEEFAQVPRPVLPHGELQARVDDLAAQQKQLIKAVEARIAALPTTLQAFIDGGFASAPDLLAAQAHLAEIPDPEALKAEQEAINHAIDALAAQLDDFGPTTGADGETIPGDPGAAAAIQEQISEMIASMPTNGEIAQAQSDQALALAAVSALQDAVQREFDGMARTLHDLALQGDEAATAAEALGTEIEALNARIRELDAIAAGTHPIAFVPQAADGHPLRFPLRCRAAAGDVSLSIPLVFVKDYALHEDEFLPEFRSLTDPGALDAVAALWAEHARVPLPGVPIDMVNSGEAEPAPGDVHEVHGLTIDAVPHDGSFRPRVLHFDVALPTLRTLQPATDGVRTLHFTDAFLSARDIPEVPFAFDPTFAPESTAGIAIDFVGRADRSGGLVSPRFVIDSISRSLGPVASRALPPALATALPSAVPRFDLEQVYAGATLLGFPLTALIKLPPDPLSAVTNTLPKPVKITQLLDGTSPTGMQMSWTLDLDEHGPFRPTTNTKLILTVESSPATQATTCTVNDFSLVLPPGGTGEGLLKLDFLSLRFTQEQGRSPDLAIRGLTLGFGGALRLLQDLQTEIQKVIGLPNTGPKVVVRPVGLTAGYSVSVPSVPMGTFLIRNIAMFVGVDVPFDGKPVTVSLSFATRDDPFLVTVLAFGGGGYVDLTIGPGGLTSLEASIDFGAAIEVDFLVATGEVHAVGGVRFRQSGGSIDIDGFLSIGGSVEVLGLVSVSIELLVTLTYHDDNRLVGRATIVVEIDLTLFSDSVEIDSGEWVLAGSAVPLEEELRAPRPPLLAADDGALAAWKAYREAFALS